MNFTLIEQTQSINAYNYKHTITTEIRPRSLHEYEIIWKDPIHIRNPKTTLSE